MHTRHSVIVRRQRAAEFVSMRVFARAVDKEGHLHFLHANSYKQQTRRVSAQREDLIQWNVEYAVRTHTRK